jgi:regulator of protease activity HflC (stomatin/prohibitin superfamily)
LQRILDEKTNPWGITVQLVEIRDVRIPQATRRTQAERGSATQRRLGKD